MVTREVEQADAGIRLDRWFKRNYPGVSHGLLEKCARKGHVRVDGLKAKPSDRVEAGQVLTFPESFEAVDRGERPVKKTMAQPNPADIHALQQCVIFKNEHVLVLNKPASLAVQGGSGQAKHVDGMLEHLRFGADERPRLVHRLDRDTSGCLLIARSARAAAELARQLKNREMEKTYLALVIGMPMPLQGVIQLPLLKKMQGKDSRMEAREAVEVDEEEGKYAVTEYRVIEHLSDRLSWVELVAVTGRTHQLRVHMAAIGHPIVGDGKYGGPEAFVRGGLALPRQLHLHAWRIVVPDLFGTRIKVTAPLPPHMRESEELLGTEVGRVKK